MGSSASDSKRGRLFPTCCAHDCDRSVYEAINDSPEKLDVRSEEAMTCSAEPLFEQTNGILSVSTIQISKGKHRVLGLHLETLDGMTGLVTSVSGGAAEIWNQENQHLAIKTGDRIMEVNGAQGKVPILKRLREDDHLTIKLSRAIQRSISLTKAGRSLGIDVLHANKSSTLVIQRVFPGVINDWNENNEGLEIKKGDRIFQVNGSCDASQFLNLIKECEKLDLRLYCYR